MNIKSDAIQCYLNKLHARGESNDVIKRRLNSVDKFIDWAYQRKLIKNDLYKQLKGEIAKQIDSRFTIQDSRLQYKIKNFETAQREVELVESEAAKKSNTINIVTNLKDKLSKLKSYYLKIHKSLIVNRKSYEFGIQHYIALILIFIFIATLGAGIYQNFFQKVNRPFAYPATPNRASRMLSFQGRLTDSLGNPITAKTDTIFNLYNVSTGGTAIYTYSCTGTTGLTPDQDGVLNALIGDTSVCNAGQTQIPDDIFSQNTNVYLGVTVGGDAEMTPRQPIANVGYAINAETLQGLPPGTGKSNIPYINSDGDLLIATASPQILSSYKSGNFKIGSANTLVLQSGHPDISGGDIVLQATGSASIIDFRTGGSDNTYSRLFIDNSVNSGNVGIGTTSPQNKLDVAGTAQMTGFKMPTGAQNTYVLTSDANGVGTWADVSGSAGPWTLSGSNLYPDQTSYNVAVGASLAGSAKLYVNGNVGIGTTNPGGKLEVYGGNTLFTSDGTDIIKIMPETSTVQTATGNSLVLRSSSNGIGYMDVMKQMEINFNTLDQTGTRNFQINHGSTQTPVFTITGGTNVGNVGIGTTNPANKLDINGTARTTGDFGVGWNGSVSPLTITASSNPVLQSYYDTTSLSLIAGSTANYQSKIVLQANNPNPYISFFTGGSEKIRLNTNGNVGIGTTNPTYKLDVNGDIRIASGSDLYVGTYGLNDNASANSGSSLMGLYDDSMTYVAANTTVQGAIKELDTAIGTVSGSAGGWTDDGTLVRLTTSTDHVGIGTTSNYAKLSLAGEADETQFAIRANSTQTTPIFRVDNSTGATNYFTVAGGGNVGIGTTSPGTSLHVEKANQTLSGSGTTSLSHLALTTNNAQGVNVGASIGLGGKTNDAATTDRLFGVIAGRKENSTTANTSGYLNFYTHLNGTGLQEHMRITSAGNVGIGTTAPGAKLEIAGQVKITGGTPGANKYLMSDANGLATWETIAGGITPDSLDFTEFKDVMTLDNNTAINMAGYNFGFQGTGNVGVGTTVPDAKLTIQAASGGIGNVMESYKNSSGDTRFTFLYDGINIRYSIGNRSSSSLLTIAETSGNIGIGTTNPAYKLDVSGTGRFTSTVVGADATLSNEFVTLSQLQGGSGSLWLDGGNYLYPNSTFATNLAVPSGNLGVGNTTPSYNLDVTGTLRSTSTSWLGSELSGQGLYVASSGNVGVGTTNPLTALYTTGNVTAAKYCDNSQAGACTSYMIPAASSTAFNLYLEGGGKSYFSGNVGIGTTSSSRQFQVNSGTATTYLDTTNGTWVMNNGNQNTTIGANGNGGRFIVGSGNTITMGGSGNAILYLGVASAYSFTTTGWSFTAVSPNVATTGTPKFMNVAETFAPTSGTAAYTDLYLGSTLNQTGGANGITRGLYINPTLTAVADYRALEIANNSNFAIYQSGSSAANYFAGNVGIGNTTPSYNLDVTGTLRSTSTSWLGSGLTGQGLYVASSGNVGVGTTAPGALLDLKRSNLASDNETIIFRAQGFNQTIDKDLANTRLNQFSQPFLVGTTNNPTVTNASTLYIAGPPGATAAGAANITISSSTGLKIDTADVTSINGVVNNAYGLYVDAPTGAANNYAAVFTGGNVGIGATNPLEMLYIDNSTSSSPSNLSLGNNYQSTAGSVNNTLFVYGSSGGTTNYGVKLQYTGSEYGTMMFGPNQANRFLSFGKTGASWHDDDMVEYMRIDLDNGNVGIGTSNPANTLDVNGTVRVGTLNSGSYSANLNVSTTNVLTTNTSDVRFKKNITTIDHALDKVLNLRGVTFNWNDENNPKRMTGMIAQEVLPVMPELVFQNPTDDYYGLFYGETSGLLVEAIKEQQQQISSLSTNYALLSTNFSTNSLGIGTSAPDLALGKVIDTSTGAYLSSGGVWTNTSDVGLKENFTALNNQEILDKIGKLDITQWNYKKENQSVKHIGPTAQNFFNIFGLGGSDKTISTIDPSGIALAGIQALKAKYDDLRFMIQDLGIKIDKLTAKLDSQISNIQDPIINNQKIISPIVETENLIATGTARLNKIETNEITSKEENLMINLDKPIQPTTNSTDSTNKGELAKLIIKGMEGKTVATIDASGSAAFAGTVTANEIIASSSSFLSSNIQDLTSETASISGTLSAKEIKSENIDNLSSNVNDIQKILAEIKNQPISDTKYYQNLDSNQLNQSSQSASLITDLTDLTVTGNSNLYDVTVANSLNVGNLYVRDNSILSLSWELKLSALNSINLLDGAVVIAKDGSLTTQGEIIAKSGIKTNTIKPINEGENITITLNSKLQNSNDKQITNNKLQITNNGNEVASIDASGSAYFKALSLEKFTPATPSATIIAAPDNFTKNGIFAPAIETKYETAGIGLLPENSNEIIIYNENIKNNSLIYLTPTDSAISNQLSVIRKEFCQTNSTDSTDSNRLNCRPYFKVSVNNNIHEPIKFNWLIIN